MAAAAGWRRAKEPLTVGGAGSAPQLAGSEGNRDTLGRRPPILGPPGHVGASAHSSPQPAARATRRNFSSDAGGREAEPSLRRSHCEALRVRRPGRAQGRVASDPFGTLDRSLDRDSIGTYRKDGKVRAIPSRFEQNPAEETGSKQV